MPGQPLSLEAVLSGMKDGTLLHRSILIRLTLLLALVSGLLALAQGSGAFFQAIGFGISIFIGVVYAGMVILVFCVEGQDRTLSGLWKSLGPALAPLVWVSLIAAAGVAAGLIMLIIPGLIILTLWIVAPPVTVVEKPGVFASLSRSRELVRGNGLRVFLFLVLLGMLVFFAAMFGAVVALPFGTGTVGAAVGTFILSAAINPLTAIGPAALYNCLVKSPADVPDIETGGEDERDPAESIPSDHADSSERAGTGGG
jgi:hypothetical protein